MFEMFTHFQEYLEALKYLSIYVVFVLGKEVLSYPSMNDFSSQITYHTLI
jgi:hypothetical protein